MAGWKGVKTLKKSAISGVAITQFVEEIPKGCSTPDFERKPITLSLQEGKNAIFRTVVKGEPKPQVIWKCKNREMDDPQKYQTSFSADTNEFFLQINKITSEDADLYRCVAVNEYGEATCTAGLKIIEVGFKKKTNQFPTEQEADLKKEIQDFRKTLKKRVPSVAPKKKMDMEQIGQLLLNADKKDYEKICLTYGVVDFRGMLRKLQEMKKEREDEQGEDGQNFNFGLNDDNIKNCLEQEGKNYITINDLHPEDAGIYQIKAENADIFSTQLEAENIPVSFRYPLGEVRCHEKGNAIFQCTFYDACFNAVWFHKKDQLESNDKYDLSVSNDGLIHHLVIKNTQLSDKGTYSIDTGSCSSSAWLEVEPSKGKRKESEEDSSDKSGQWSKPLDEEHAKKLHQGERQKDQDLLADFSMGKDAQYGNGQDSSAVLYSSQGKDGCVGSDGKIEFCQNAVIDDNSKRMSGLAGKDPLYGQDVMLGFSTGLEGPSRWQTSEVHISTFNGEDHGDRGSLWGFHDSTLGNSKVNNQYIMGGNVGHGLEFGRTGRIERLYDNKCVLSKSDQPGDTTDSTGSICIKNGGLSDTSKHEVGFSNSGTADVIFFKDGMLSEVGRRDKFYDKSNVLHRTGADEPGSAGGKAGLCRKDGTLEELSGARKIGGFYGKDDYLDEVNTNGFRPIDKLYGNDSMQPALDNSRSVGSNSGFYGKDGISFHGPGTDEKVSQFHNRVGKLIKMEEIGEPCNTDGTPDESEIGAADSDGEINTLCAKNAMLGEIWVNGYGNTMNIAGPSDKDGIANKAGGYGGRVGTGGFCDKDSMPSEAGNCESSGPSGHGGKGFVLERNGGTGRFCGKDDMPDEAWTTGTDGIGKLYSKDIMPCRFYADGYDSVKKVNGICVNDGMSGIEGTRGLHGDTAIFGCFDKNDMIVGTDADQPGSGEGLGSFYHNNSCGANGVGETVALYCKNGMSVRSIGLGEVSEIYGKDNLVGENGTNGPSGAGGITVFYSKDGMPDDAGTVRFDAVQEESELRINGMLDGGGAGCIFNGKYKPTVTVSSEFGHGGIDESYNKESITSGTFSTGFDGAVVDCLYDNDSSASISMFYGKDSMPLNADTNKLGGISNTDSTYGKDRIRNATDISGVGGVNEHDMVVEAGPTGYTSIDEICVKNEVGGTDSVGQVSILSGMKGEKDAGLCKKDDISNGTALGRPDGSSGKNYTLIGSDAAGGLDGLYGKNVVAGGGSSSVARKISGFDGKEDRALHNTLAGGTGFSNEGEFNYHKNRDGALSGDDIGTAVRDTDGSLNEKKSDMLGEEFLGYGQSSGLYNAVCHTGDRRRQQSDLEASGSTPTDLSSTRDRKGRGESLLEEDMREPFCRLDQGLSNIHAQKGRPTVLSCSLNNDQIKGTWFKDGVKIIGLKGVLAEKNGLTHKLIIDKVEDNHAGKYKFEAEGICTEAFIFVEDPPNVEPTFLEKLKEPIVVKAGKNAMVKIPFEGQKPIRVTWLKGADELLDDGKISSDTTENFTRLSISSTSRKDSGDYKVKLKNESGNFQVTFKLEVIDKPQPPTGPIEVVDSSTSGITIKWKPPRDDGGKPVQSYVIERQQVGRKTWVTLGKTNGSCTIFTTNKVEHDKSYCFRVKAMNSLGTSEALESDEMVAATEAFPSPPAPPKIISASKDAITISWSAPRKMGNSQILGYTVEKRKKGSNIWTPVCGFPIRDRKHTMTDLKEGLQYEFRVAAINHAGVGEASAPSEAVFAQDPMKPPGPVKDLKVVNTDYNSISLSWLKPGSAEDSCVKGYIVEMQSSDSLKWTQCNVLPVPRTTYTVRGLKAKEMYFLRVRAISDGGLGDPVEVDTCVKTVSPTVHPKLLMKDPSESFMKVKAGDAIHLHIPFKASPSPEVVWLKDGLSLPAKATTATRESLSQLIIPGAEFSDSGHYAMSLLTEEGKKESFSFLVHVLDVPESPGPIQLTEKVSGTVTLIWEPSPTEKRESNLTYMVMRRDSRKGSWQMVADKIYTNKCTIVNVVPGREYFFRVLAKNCIGVSKPSETVQPWSIQKEKGKPELRLPRYKGINQGQPPRFLVQLKPHVVNLGFDCHMSCAVTGYPAPQITWYKGNKNLSQDPTFFCKNDFGVCSIIIPRVTPSDGGQYKVLAINELGQAISKAEVTVKGKD